MRLPNVGACAVDARGGVACYGGTTDVGLFLRCRREQCGGYPVLSNIGWPELVIVLIIVMVVFGAGRLPQIGEGLGKAIRNLKRGLKSDDDIEVTPKEKRVEARSSATKLSDEVSDAEVVER